MIVVSDTTPIISLLKIGRLDLLQLLFGRVVIPQAVYDELTGNSLFQNEMNDIKNADFISTMHVEDIKSVELLMRATGLDTGESEAIILSDECKAEILLIDEAKGRKVAKQMGFTVMGTIGMLSAAFQNKLISGNEIKKYISLMKKAGRHISNELYMQLLKEIDES